MLTISDKAIEFIIKEENSDEAYYTKLCTGFEWPGGASGPTVGIGYDCGYCRVQEIKDDWDELIPDEMINVLVLASGITGERAHGFVQHYRHHVNIPWNVAVQQFVQREVPKWVTRVTNVLPNCDKLSPDSLGALVSLAYNRGPSFRAVGDRCVEMRGIYDCMVSQKFDRIPALFISMRRLWPQGGDLWRRRMHEADLFKAGLSNVSVTA